MHANGSGIWRISADERSNYKITLYLPSDWIHRHVNSWKYQLRTKIWYVLCTKHYNLRLRWSVYFHPGEEICNSMQPIKRFHFYKIFGPIRLRFPCTKARNTSNLVPRYPDRRRCFCVTRRDNHALFLSLFIGVSHRKGGWQSRLPRGPATTCRYIAVRTHTRKAATCVISVIDSQWKDISV